MTIDVACTLVLRVDFAGLPQSAKRELTKGFQLRINGMFYGFSLFFIYRLAFALTLDARIFSRKTNHLERKD